jgi:hypothetical protein
MAEEENLLEYTLINADGYFIITIIHTERLLRNPMVTQEEELLHILMVISMRALSSME